MRSADPSANGNGNGTPRARPGKAAPVPASLGADELLAEFFSGGDEAAFGEVVRRYAGMVFATCLRVTRDAHDAEDATQATFLTLAVQGKTGKPVRKLTPWLQQVAKRAALDLKRSRSRREAHEHRQAAMAAHSNGQLRRGLGDGSVAAPASAPSPQSDELDLEKVNKALAEEVARLPAKYRLPLISLYFGGMSRQDVAREMGCTPAALSVRVHRGRQMLAKRLSARGVVMGKAAGQVLAGGVLAAGVGAALREALVARTAEAVAGSMLGKNLGAAVSANVLAIVRAAALGAGAGGLLAKLKVPVLLALLVVGVTASASGGAARLRDAVAEWSGELQLAPAVKRIMQMLRSPFRAPQASAAATESSEETTGRPPTGGVGGGRAIPGDWVDAAASRLPVSRPANAPQAAAPGASCAGGVIPVAPSSSRVAGASPTTPRNPPGTAPRHGPPNPARSPAAPRVNVPPRAVAVAGRASSSPAPADASPPDATREGDVVLSPDGWLSRSLLPGGPSDRVPVVGPALTIAAAPGSRGVYRQVGGALWAAAQDIGRQGLGRFEHFGGFNAAAQVRLGGGAGGSGRYELTGGTLGIVPQFLDGAGPVAGGVQVGGLGRGQFLLGDAHSPGNMVFSGAFSGGWPTSRYQAHAPGSALLPGAPPRPAPGSDLVIRGDPRGAGLVRGWGGAIGNGGALVNNGQVIADGYGTDRALVMLGYSSVTNTIDNADNRGANGWFAQGGGRLFLPKIATAAGTHTYTWGESPADPTIDLVNSVRLTLRDAANPGKVDVSLLDKNRADVPELPRGHTFIGVWSIDTGTTRPAGGVDLTVRYDDGLARELGLNEGSLKLWRYGDGQWLRINDASFSRDVARNLLSGHSGPGLSFFAVSAPEPGAVGMALLVGGALMLRRRR